MSGTETALEKRRENIIMIKRKRNGVKIYMESKLLLGDCKDKLKEFENTKNSINSITWNMVGTMATTMMIVFILSH